MSAQFFLNVEQVLDILMAELPANVYASDRADDPDFNKRSYSSSELRAHAQVFANLYENLLAINSDKFISTVTLEGLSNWEKELFASAQDSMQPYVVRQQNLLAKYRASGGISLPAIASVVHGILDPVGLAFDILPFCGQSNGMIQGAWLLGISALGLDTFLALRDPLFGAQQDQTPLDCDLDYAAAGITAQDLLEIQVTAYTYEVKIYGVADAATLALLDQQLTALEPARSTHVITNNASGPVDPDVLDLGPFDGDTRVDDIDFGDFGPTATFDIWDFGGFI